MNKLHWITVSLTALLVLRCGPTPPEPSAMGTEIFSDTEESYSRAERSIHFQAFVSNIEDTTGWTIHAEVTFGDSTQNHLLNDLGTAGDHIAGDFIFARNISYFFPDTLSGILTVIYRALQAGVEKETVTRDVTLTANSAPQILSITAPDTVLRPLAGELDTILVVAEVIDPDGLDDIIQVTFEVESVDHPGIWINSAGFFLQDAGIGADDVAGDGFYSIGLLISSTNRIAQNVFRYRAKDQSGNFSPYAYDTITVYENAAPEVTGFMATSASIPRQTGLETPFRTFLEISDANGISDIQNVALYILYPDSSFAPAASLTVNNDANNGDVIADDDILTLNSTLDQDAPLGNYSVYAEITDKQGNQATSDTISFNLVNVLPVFVSVDYLSAVTLPIGTQNDTIHIEVNDDNGLADITAVTYKLKSPADNNFGTELAAVHSTGGEYYIPVVWTSTSATGSWFYRIWVKDRENWLSVQTIEIQVTP